MKKKSVLENMIRKILEQEKSKKIPIKESTQTIELLSNEIEIGEADLKQFLSILKKNNVKYDISLPF